MGCHTWFFRPIAEGETSCNYCEHSETGFTDVGAPHNLFRVGGYPEDKLLSLEETLDFIERNKETVSFSENWERKLVDFWEKNPNGVIEFG